MTTSCPHDCTDGWLRPNAGKATRCPWCSERGADAAGPPISLFEKTGRHGLADARSVLANASPPAPHPGPIDPMAGMNRNERAHYLAERAGARALNRTGDDAA